MAYYRQPEYHVFCAARDRCIYEHHPSYKNYGGRGIKFLFTCYEEFLNHIGPRPSTLHSLDRINNDGNYEPGNVRWVTRDIQNRNCRPKKKKIVCRRGHPLTPENTAGERRRCRICLREKGRRHYYGQHKHVLARKRAEQRRNASRRKGESTNAN